MSVESIKAGVHEREHPERVSFWFVRHGESDENTQGDRAKVMHDTPLTADGIKEIQELADYLFGQPIRFSHIYSSSKARALQTAEILAQKLNLHVIVMPGLDERNWGEHKDKPWTEVSEKLSGMSLEDRYSHVPEGGESWQNMEDRLLEALEDITKQSKGGENILIVTHKGDLRAIMPLLAKAGKEKHEEFSVPLGSISKFSFDKDEFDFIGHKPGKNNE